VTGAAGRGGITGRLARAAARRPWWTIAAWGGSIVLALAAMALLFAELDPEGRLTTDPESVRGHELKEQHFGEEHAPTEFVVLRSETVTADEPAFEERVAAVLSTLEGAGIVEHAADPRETPGLAAPDGRAVLIPVRLTEEGRTDVEPLVDAVRAEDGRDGFEAGVTGAYTIGRDFTELAARDLREGELQFGLPAAFVILVLVFGALVSALVPLALAAVSILVALGLTALLSQGFELSIFIVNMLIAMGLALGIDYALFVLSRFREERAAGRERADAIAMAGGTASRAVLFSGSAFVLAMVGLLLVPDTVMRSLAAGAILVAIVAVVAALTLLPALLALLGDRVNRLRVPFLGRRVIERGGQEGRLWGAIVRVVLRRPGLSLAAAVSVLVLAAAPVLTMSLGQIGMETLPDDLPSKQGYLLMERSYPAAATDPAEVLVEGDVGSAEVQAGIERLGEAVAADAGFGDHAVQPSPTGEAALITIPLASDPYSSRSVAAVERLRAEHVPGAFGGVEAEALVTGATAFTIDYVAVISTWLPIVIAFVLALSFVLMTVAFRSVVIAGTAIVLNLLSVGAAYGLVVAVFQHGIGAGLLGFREADVIAPWIPLFMFAVLFGLSMDYQVFLLSRIRERYVKTGDTSDAIAYGIGSTARLITGAALIIVAVFAGFAAGELVMFQQMGFGVAVALLIDATIIRSVLVPAAMGVLGERNWYLPRRLDWIPHMEVEGAAAAPEAAASGRAPAGVD
jgi:putative drug exporter of the RND superfamily